MQTNNEPAPVYIRVNNLRATPAEVRSHLQEAGVQVEITPFGSNVMIVSEGPPQLTKSFSDGEFYIQDAGIEKLGEWIDPQAGGRILEIAAAPGGKTLQLANRMQDKGLIVSLDAELSRMKQWQRNISRLGIANAVPLVADARVVAFTATFDTVVVDAPCSSLGVIRRHPEIKWWRVPEDLPPLQALQLQIMESCCRYVDQSGELVYVVCSFEPEETLEVTEKFVQAHSEFELTGKKFLYPHRDQTDGFFLAKFKKNH
jgi:16S rRNA (cytosine967-C5)-methyltransferase